MKKMKLLLDTNIVIDYVARREPFCDKATLMMIAGRVGEFSLWIASSQVTDLIFVLTDGGKKAKAPQVLEALRTVRRFINVFPVTDSDIDTMLAASWDDPEDGLLIDLALKIGADAIISRDEELSHTDMMPVFDCEEFFAWLEAEYGISYDEAHI